MVHHLADGIGDRRHFGHRTNAARVGLLVAFPATRPKGAERSRYPELGLSAETRHLGRPPMSAGDRNKQRPYAFCQYGILSIFSILNLYFSPFTHR